LKIKELQRCNSFFFFLYDTNLIQILDFDVPFKCIETVSYLMKFHKILPYQPHLFAYRCLIFLSGEDKIPLLSNCCGNLAWRQWFKYCKKKDAEKLWYLENLVSLHAIL